jgi:hypothetical protein
VRPRPFPTSLPGIPGAPGDNAYPRPRPSRSSLPAPRISWRVAPGRGPLDLCRLARIGATVYAVNRPPEESDASWDSLSRQLWIGAAVAIVIAGLGVALVLLNSVHHSTVTLQPSPTVAPTPTRSPSPGQTAVQTPSPAPPITLVVPPTIAVTVNGGSSGMPGWETVIGAIITTLGAFAALVAVIFQLVVKWQKIKRKEAHSSQDSAAGGQTNTET